MKRLSVLCIVLITAGLLFTLATAGAKNKDAKSKPVNVSLIPIDSSLNQIFLLFWEEITKSDSQIYYKQISGIKTFGKKSLTREKNEYHDPAVDYDQANGLYITYNEINKIGSNVIVLGRREDPDIFESREDPDIFDKKINIKFPKNTVY
ncbi:MAG: hypothetical protein A2161_20575 [Candidatus Schekmanbacteria bacterium RBG_13_48_7]|uniref:Uncharacterized protein n=1 Tax=Candidatus Schekmanbacteria bacterium RBG_13_48_7 TaxID=1817878 RepID=A0A1F7RMJ1_9BACT|nr:MAG: hypothetical protein A2161_20575 [Candidatus Schekmanbacteria bacterium RBG_13_48_7]